MTLTKPTTSRGIGCGGVCAAPALCSGFPFASYSWWSLPFSGLRSTSQSRPAFDADCCRPTSATGISSTRCPTPSCRRIGSRIAARRLLDAARLRADTLNEERILPRTGNGRPSAPAPRTPILGSVQPLVVTTGVLPTGYLPTGLFPMGYLPIGAVETTGWG
jgi:hypothetical protein